MSGWLQLVIDGKVRASAAYKDREEFNSIIEHWKKLFTQFEIIIKPNHGNPELHNNNRSR